MAGKARSRILLLLTGVFVNGGIQRFNHTLLSALATLDLECEVLSMHDSNDVTAQHTLGPNVTIKGFDGSRWRFLKTAFRCMCSNRYEWLLIGHINLLVFTISAVMLSPWHRPKAVMIAHGIEVWTRVGRLRRIAFTRLYKTLCVSRYTQQRILDQVPNLDRKRVAIFPNCLCNTWTGMRPTGVRLARTAPFVLSVSRLERGDRYKGIVTVIEALSQLEDGGIHYIIVGEGNDMPFLKEVAIRCNVSHRVHFLRGISDAELVHLYSQCMAFVLPSGKEGFGIVFLEAMYFGAPVIAAAEKGALDVVNDGETGLLVPFGDSMAVKRAIERLNTDTGLREHLREHARATVVGESEFTFARFAKRTAAVFHPSENPVI